MKDCRILGFIAAATLFWVAGDSGAEEQIPRPSSRHSGDPKPSVARELELLKQRIEELETAKRAHEDATRRLNQRIEELETAKRAHEDATRTPNQRVEELGAPKTARKDATRRIEQRVEELEKAKIAHDDATRTIIRQSFAERAASINDYVDFSGTLEALISREKDLTTGDRTSDIKFETADLDFKIKASDWVLGSLILSFDPGTNVLFPTTRTSRGGQGVDRITVREGLITFGNTERFPLFGRAGRAVVPFGTSTGDPVTSSLTLVNPLTIEVFETREDFIMFGFEAPTPPPPPPLPTTPVPSHPVVRPLLINPLVSKLSTWLCSSLPCYPPSPKPVPPAIPPIPRPPFTAAVYFYKGDTGGGNHLEHVGGTLGYQTKGYFPGRRIPWAIDFDVDYNSSVFDSDFLASQYQPFLPQIGNVPGMAAHLKSNLGPIGFIVEWNGAIDNATFTDQALDPETGAQIPGRAISIRPSTWQVELAYQFDFNPYLESIGAQGTYFVVGYSESEDLAGVRRVIPDPSNPLMLMREKVGFVPERRLSVGLGEWVVPGFRVAIEYSHLWDYAIAKGGTGNSANGMFMQFTYEW